MNSGWRRKLAGLFAVAAVSVYFSAAPAGAEPSFETWLAAVKKEAAGLGISNETLEAAFAGVKPIARVIELDRKQPEFTLTFEDYQRRVVSDQRRKKGRERLAENLPLLREIEAKYGVQPRFIVAFWGIETDFGRITGGFPVIASLATLAHDGRRGKFFRKQLMHALKILDEGHIAPADMVGSWAGAMGQCQFLPSSFVAYAQDYDGDGRRDIWGTRADVFASAANYLKRVGWRGDQTWGRKVTLPEDFDLALADGKKKKTISAWQALGVRNASGGDLPGRDLQAAIVLPTDGARAPAYMVYGNYEAILRWNRSHYFAIAVGTLSDAIRAGG